MHIQVSRFDNLKSDWPDLRFIESRPTVCIQGLGFVGTAMALAIADSREANNVPAFNVIGVELDNPAGKRKIAGLKEGRLPIDSDDPAMSGALDRALKAGNFIATTNEDAYKLADTVVVDVHCDVDFSNSTPELKIGVLETAIKTIASHIRPSTLVLIETTVPPGTTEKIVAPIIREGFNQRGMNNEPFLLAHSYERVMPGPEYFDSVKNFWRVFAGHTPEAANATRRFLEKVINTEQYPLTELHSTTASEMAKIIENAYRAVNIAFIDEWSRMADAVNVDLFDVLSAIRVRPTHNNIRYPGFGVGGYCLTKDALFGELSLRQIFKKPGNSFPLSKKALEINRELPLVALDKLKQYFGGSIQGKNLLLLGVSYRSGVSDTRYSASEIFMRTAIEAGAKVFAHDPLVQFWEEMDLPLEKEMPVQPPDSRCWDAIVVAVDHKQYKVFDFTQWLDGRTTLLLDGNGVLSLQQRRKLRQNGCTVLSIGRGDKCE